MLSGYKRHVSWYLQGTPWVFMFFQIRFDMSCTRKKQQPLSLTDGDGRSGNQYYTVTRTNTSSYSPQLWARCPTCSSSRQLCPHLWCLGLGMTKAEWLPKDSSEDSMRIWRKTNAERQALRGCCGGLVDRKVHSKKVHSQRMEIFKMEWRSYSSMKKI